MAYEHLITTEHGDAGLRANGMRVGDEPQGRAEERAGAIWQQPWRKPQ